MICACISELGLFLVIVGPCEQMLALREAVETFFCKMGNCIDVVYKSCRRHPYSKAGVRIEQNTLPQTVRDYVSSGTSVMSAVLAALFNMKNMPGQWDPVLW